LSHLVLVEFCNKIDEQGYYKDAQIINEYLIKCAKRKRVPNYKNIALALTPIVASMLLLHLNRNEPTASQPPQKSTQVKSNPIKPTPLPRGDFDGFVSFLSKVEGGVSNRKKQFDSGGLTNLGITQKTYDNYRAGKNIPRQSVKNITIEEKNDIVKSQYWDPIKGDYLPRAIALVLADWKFNGGNPVRAVQRLLKIPATGKMDKNTVVKIWQYTQNKPENEKELAQKLISARQKYLESLRTTVKRKRVPLINYNRGWYKRLNEIKQEATNPED
jgi:lysozyme family protein